MRLAAVLAILVCGVSSSVIAQEPESARSQINPSAPIKLPTGQSAAPLNAADSASPSDVRAEQTAPQRSSQAADGEAGETNRGGDASPFRGGVPQNSADAESDSTFNLNDSPSDILGADDLDFDAGTQSFDFDDESDYSFDTSLDNSIASNSNIRGASPQMIGDFGGGSTMFSIGGFVGSNSLSVPLPFAGGGRRIKIAENNQVLPLSRVYSTFNYFHNASPIIGTLDSGMIGAVSQVDSESVVQYTFGAERAFFNDLFSIDVRMPITGGVDQYSFNPGSLMTPVSTELFAASGVVGDLSVTFKTFLLQRGNTYFSGGFSVSVPTGSDIEVDAIEAFTIDLIDIGNDAYHVMPFAGLYQEIEDQWWLQGFVQVDVPTNGHEVRTNGVFRGRLTEQTLLYADVSLGKWLYREPCNSRARGGRGLTGLATVLELHYTTSLNDADGFDVSDFTGSAIIGDFGPGFENRFDVLNLTMGLQAEFGERWRANVAGVIPLREGRFEDFSGRREDQFFDGELVLQLNRFF